MRRRNSGTRGVRDSTRWVELLVCRNLDFFLVHAIQYCSTYSNQTSPSYPKADSDSPRSLNTRLSIWHKRSTPDLHHKSPSSLPATPLLPKMASTIPIEPANGVNPEEKPFDFESLKAHGTREDLWMLLHDKVYNVTKFIDEVGHYRPHGQLLLATGISSEGSEADVPISAAPGRGRGDDGRSWYVSLPQHEQTGPFLFKWPDPSLRFRIALTKVRLQDGTRLRRLRMWATPTRRERCYRRCLLGNSMARWVTI